MHQLQLPLLLQERPQPRFQPLRLSPQRPLLRVVLPQVLVLPVLLQA